MAPLPEVKLYESKSFRGFERLSATANKTALVTSSGSNQKPFTFFKIIRKDFKK